MIPIEIVFNYINGLSDEQFNEILLLFTMRLKLMKT